jgi:hypothetical protein
MIVPPWITVDIENPFFLMSRLLHIISSSLLRARTPSDLW